MTGDQLENPDVVVRSNQPGQWWFEPISRPAEDFLAAYLGDNRPSREIIGGKALSGTKSFLVPGTTAAEVWRAAAKGLVIRHVP